MTVFPAGPERADALAALHAAAFAAAWSGAEFAELLGSPGVTAFEAEGGFILLRAAVGEAEVLTLAVAPGARRRGLGRALVRAGLAAACAEGAGAVFLEVAEGNAAALGLYESEGFELSGRRRGYYARPGGKAEDALLLRRVLNTPGA